MTTSLQAQLAQIASKSTNPLDLKARRKAYSKSLLFESDVAASQDLDTLYEICVDGFNDLCGIDARFQQFSKTLFSEQSKYEDRSQLNQSENEDLNAVLESFLGLLEARMLLKPAMKALEWLVRHFRIHELNTESLLCSFLPYHDQPIFGTLLSVLPRKLPVPFQFLSDCMERFRGPSRPELVFAATRHPELFRIWSAHVLAQCRHGYDFQAMTAYWASVSTEATLGRIEQASRGNRASQQQKEEALLLEILPMLIEGFQIRESVELRIACHMILTILASKLTLADNVLEHMMEAAVMEHIPETKDAELICLSILSQRRGSIKVPHRVLKTLLSSSTIYDDLLVLKAEYQVSNLAGALIKAMLRNLKKHKDRYRPEDIVIAIDGQLIDNEQSVATIRDLIAMATSNGKSRSLATQTLSMLHEQKVGQYILHAAIEEAAIGVTAFDESLQNSLKMRRVEETMDWEAAKIPESRLKKSEVEPNMPLSDLPEISGSEYSFLGDEDTVFAVYYKAFRGAEASPNRRQEFCDLPSLDRNRMFSRPVFLSFFIRLCTGPHPAELRALALDCIRDSLQKFTSISPGDVQTLLPYLLFWLSDTEECVRAAAVDLAIVLKEACDFTAPQSSYSTPAVDICGRPTDTNGEIMLAITNIQTLVEFLVSNLEEYRSDPLYLGIDFHNVFTQSSKKHRSKARVELKSSQKDAILLYLAKTIFHTRIHAVRFRLLHLLNQTGISTNNAISEELLGIIHKYYMLGDEGIRAAAGAECLDPEELAFAIVTPISASSQESLTVMRELISGDESMQNSLLRAAALQRISQLWVKMNVAMQTAMALILFEKATEQNLPEQRVTAVPECLETLQQMTLNAPVLVKLLDSLPPIPASITSQDSPSSKRRKVHQRQFHSTADRQNSQELMAYITKATIALELIESSAYGSDLSLLNPLFGLLSDLHNIKTSDPRVEYAQITLLSILTPVIEDAKRAKLKVERSSVRADLVVDLFRSASNAQLQQASLLVMSSLASFVPEQVIHSIMPVFTFMGSSILRHADDYSVLVVEKTIESIVPPLIASLRKQTRGPIAGASELLLSFVAAFEHIPVQIRQNLFIVLVDKLGAAEFLYVLIILLLDRHENSEGVRWFASNLLAHFAPLLQLKTIEQYLRVMVDAFKPKPSLAKQLLVTESQKDVASSALTIVGFAARALRKPDLLGQITKRLRKQESEAEAIRAAFAQVLELVLNYDEQSNVHQELGASSKDLLEAALGLLPLDESIKALGGLLRSGDDKIRRSVIHSLESSISKQHAANARSRATCISLLPTLRDILTSSNVDMLKAACISCIDRVTEIFGKSDTSAVARIAPEISGSNGLQSSVPSIQLRSLLCLTTIVEALEDVFLPEIPSTVPWCLSILENQNLKTKVDDDLVQAAYSFFSSLLHYVPYIVTGEYLDRLLQASFAPQSASTAKDLAQSGVDCLALIPLRVRPNESLASLTRTWPAARDGAPHAIDTHLRLFDTVVERLTKGETVRYASTIVDLGLSVLDSRRVAIQVDASAEAKLVHAEDALNRTWIKMVYKLNDTHFRPIFTRLLDWSREGSGPGPGTPEGRLARASSCYGFVGHFFQTLQSIVTSYGGLIADDAAELLQRCAAAGDSASLLWTRVLTALAAAFEHDQDDFWQAPARIGAVLPALLAQLDAAASPAAASRVVACITHLARATDSPDHLKAINTAVLARMRAEAPALRLRAVQCQRSLTDGLGDDWLAMLPEMLPFISEAMEDDDEQVETETQAWVRRIEDTLGESLDAMLQ